MSEKVKVNRREFISRSGKVTAAVGTAVLAGPAINVMGANEKVQIGIIGPGRRGRAVTGLAQQMSAEKKYPIEFVAIADIYDSWRNLAVKEIMKNAMRYELDQTEDIATYNDHKELLEDKNVDAVFIATPEHLHAIHMMDTIAAGKDMYVEKPMVHTIEEGLEVLKAVEGRDLVIQVGTQRRSVPLYNIAGEMIRNGEIGEVDYIEGWWYRNFLKDEPNAAWRYDIPADADQEMIEWQKFLGPAPEVPFDLNRYFQWRCYWDYSNGIGSDLMVHQLDAINMVMGTGMPSSVVSSGNIYRWDDGRTSTDTWSSVFEYDEGFQVNYRGNFSSDEHFGIRIFGTDGTIEVLLSSTLNVIPVPEGRRQNKDLQARTIYYPEDNTTGDFMTAHFESVKDHYANWIDCIKSRKTPNCSVVDGFNGAALSTMAVQAYMEGRRLNWDKEKKRVFAG
ncbi:MAG: Gfo/Idh/MocA family protein [bacterium]|jgi:predicted dehydrogenase